MAKLTADREALLSEAERRKIFRDMLLFRLCLITLASGNLVGAVRLCLSLNKRLHARWVPSELNLADGPSRGLGIGAADDTVAVHVGRGVPRDLLRRLQERDRQSRRVASHW